MLSGSEPVCSNIGPDWSVVEWLYGPEVVLMSVALERVSEHVELIRIDVDWLVEYDPGDALVACWLGEGAFIADVLRQRGQ